MNKDGKCKNCDWLEIYKGDYICGYVAEVWHIAAKVNPEKSCRKDINHFKKERKYKRYENVTI